MPYDAANYDRGYYYKDKYFVLIDPLVVWVVHLDCYFEKITFITLQKKKI